MICRMKQWRTAAAEPSSQVWTRTLLCGRENLSTTSTWCVSVCHVSHYSVSISIEVFQLSTERLKLFLNYNINPYHTKLIQVLVRVFWENSQIMKYQLSNIFG